MRALRELPRRQERQQGTSPEGLQACAPKLDILTCDVAAGTTKAQVLVDRRAGLAALLEHLRLLGARLGFGVATMDELSAFKSPGANLRGERYRVMVADASTCTEGIGFFGVHRVLLADVPQTPSTIAQAVGRTIRVYSQ